jgi:hypothetical protein
MECQAEFVAMCATIHKIARGWHDLSVISVVPLEDDTDSIYGPYLCCPYTIRPGNYYACILLGL